MILVMHAALHVKLTVHPYPQVLLCEQRHTRASLDGS
jgi:hypothetical protein